MGNIYLEHSKPCDIVFMSCGISFSFINLMWHLCRALYSFVSLSVPEKGRLFRVNKLLFLAGVMLCDVAHNVNKGQALRGSITFPPYELAQVAGDHFLERSFHPFEYSFCLLPITLHVIRVGSGDGIHEIPAIIYRFMAIVPGQVWNTPIGCPLIRNYH